MFSARTSNAHLLSKPAGSSPSDGLCFLGSEGGQATQIWFDKVAKDNPRQLESIQEIWWFWGKCPLIQNDGSPSKSIKMQALPFHVEGSLICKAKFTTFAMDLVVEGITGGLGGSGDSVKTETTNDWVDCKSDA